MIFRRNNDAFPIRLSAPEVKPLRTQDSIQARKKILIVDDDPVVIKTLSLTLTSAGYDVVTAVDGPEAIAIMRDNTPDMMLVDVGLPPDLTISWDGFQVARWLRQLKGTIPIIVISGSYKPEYERQAIASGARAFFVKPLNKILLLESISSALSTGNRPSLVIKS